MRTSWARLTRIRWGVRSTPAGSTDGFTAGTANPAMRPAWARSATASGEPKPATWCGSPVNTPESTSPARTSPTWLVWPASRGTAWSRWLRNWPRNPAAAARPVGVATSPVRSRAATIAAATARVLVVSQARRRRRASGIGVGAAGWVAAEAVVVAGAAAVAVAAADAGAAVAAAVAVRAAASRARRCWSRARAASTAASLSGSAGAVRAIARAASSALRWSSARVSEQEAQVCTWSCSGAGVGPSGASMDARRAPRSGQGIVGSPVVVIEVGVAERPLAAGEQDPDRADGEVEGRGDLRVGVAGVAQQQAGPLPLRQGGEGPAHRLLLLGPEHVQQRGRAGVGLVVDPLGPSGPIQPLGGPALAPQPVVGGVQADPTQPGRDLLVGPLQHRMPVELEEGLLHDILGLTMVAEQPVPEPVQVAVPLPEQGHEPLPGTGPSPSLIA